MQSSSTEKFYKVLSVTQKQLYLVKALWEWLDDIEFMVYKIGHN